MKNEGGNDIAGEHYWSLAWASHALPVPIDPFDSSPMNRVKRHLHAEFESVFKKANLRGCRLLEIGCARSVWLPYFAKYHGCSVAGLDYSKIGCEQAEQILKREQLEGEIIHGDMFSPPAHMIGRYDCVVSFGVVEHFQDTGKAIAAMAQFLRPGGLILTLIPNMCGLIGWAQKMADRSIYDIHVPLNREQLEAAHSFAAFRRVDCSYLTLLNFGVCNLNGHAPRSWSWWRGKLFLKILEIMARPALWLESRATAKTDSRMLSSYALYVGKK